MKKILMIATGGTIASVPKDGRLAPSLSSENLLSFVPEISSLCDVSAVQLFSKDSTDMTYDDWFALSRTVRDSYALYDGFVITHGTDTMAYCAAALSYFIQGNSKPVVITGAQKSIYLRDTDARNNLYNAFVYACDDRSVGVHIIFDGEAILGTRARKTRTKGFNAFSSLDYPPVARIADGKVIRFIPETAEGEPVFAEKIGHGVAVIKLVPGLDAGVMDYFAGRCPVLVIESFGVGGLPYRESGDFERAVKKLLGLGTHIIMTTQVPHDGCDMGIYEVGEAAQRLGIIEARDMTLESIVGKSVWTLGLAGDFAEIFLTPVGADIIS